jgi:hypothetical protein
LIYMDLSFPRIKITIKYKMKGNGYQNHLFNDHIIYHEARKSMFKYPTHTYGIYSSFHHEFKNFHIISECEPYDYLL